MIVPVRDERCIPRNIPVVRPTNNGDDVFDCPIRIEGFTADSVLASRQLYLRQEETGTAALDKIFHGMATTPKDYEIATPEGVSLPMFLFPIERYLAFRQESFAYTYGDLLACEQPNTAVVRGSTSQFSETKFIGPAGMDLFVSLTGTLEDGSDFDIEIVRNGGVDNWLVEVDEHVSSPPMPMMTDGSSKSGVESDTVLKIIVPVVAGAILLVAAIALFACRRGSKKYTYKKPIVKPIGSSASARHTGIENYMGAYGKDEEAATENDEEAVAESQ